MSKIRGQLPIFEASFFATWILDPDSGRDRRLRGLRSEVLDCYQQRAHLAAFKKIPEVRELVEDAERQQAQGSLAVYTVTRLQRSGCLSTECTRRSTSLMSCRS